MTARSIAHTKQIKPTAKLAQNSALSARRGKGICILCCNSGSRPCELGAKQTIFQDEPGGRLQSRLRGSLEAIGIATKQKCKDEGEFSRQASTAEIGANAHECLFFRQVSLHWKGRCNFTLYMGQCSFLLTVLAFAVPSRSIPNWHWVPDKNCSCVRISKKYTFWVPTHQPRSRKCANDICLKQTATCTKATKTISPRRQKSRIQQPQTNANKTFSSQKLKCLATSLLHHGPKTGSKKLVETRRP